MERDHCLHMAIAVRLEELPPTSTKCNSVDLIPVNWNEHDITETVANAIAFRHTDRTDRDIVLSALSHSLVYICTIQAKYHTQAPLWMLQRHKIIV